MLLRLVSKMCALDDSVVAVCLIIITQKLNFVAVDQQNKSQAANESKMYDWNIYIYTLNTIEMSEIMYHC